MLNKKTKNEESQLSSESKVLKSFLKSVVTHLFSSLSKSFMQEINELLMKKLRSLEKMLLIAFVSHLLTILGAIFVVASVFILLAYYLKIHLAWSFLAIGVFLLLWSWVLKQKN